MSMLKASNRVRSWFYFDRVHPSLAGKQAVRVRKAEISPGTDQELGLALMRLEAKLQDLKTQFGLADEDLNLDLGPIGRLI
jgi:hypothetical protein